MEPVNVEPFKVYGIRIDTTNESEMESTESKIPDLWKRFYTDHYGQTLSGSPVYGVYTNYESDVNGRYSVLAGVRATEAHKDYQEVKIERGKYLVFRREGEPSEAVVAAWQQVWEYFENPSKEYERAYTSDFEVYEGQDQVAIYIAIK